eukprot:10480780-Ditylum_brightwellii.AAC.1
MTYPILVPYFKGVHLTLETWRSNQDAHGLKYSDKEWLALRAYMSIDQADDASNVPVTVHGSTRLVSDLKALAELMNYDNPAMRLLCGINISQALYGFGDVSKGGFGSSFSTHKGLQYRIGVWGHSISQNSSN